MKYLFAWLAVGIIVTILEELTHVVTKKAREQTAEARKIYGITGFPLALEVGAYIIAVIIWPVALFSMIFPGTDDDEDE